VHFQATVSGWKEALLAMPDGAVVKAFDAGMLKEAKLTWAAAGRDVRQLYTVLRHFDVHAAGGVDWEGYKAHWRRMFARCVDGTFLSQEFYRYIDIYTADNEFTSVTTWQNEHESHKAYSNMAAAADVWNSDYRARPEFRHMRLALMSGPVANPWPRRVTKLAVDTDSYLDYHPYELCVDGTRVHDSWRWHSGLWHFLEQEHGLKPLWLFGEAGPYRDAVQGWRHPLCLGHDESKLVAVMEAWWRDCAQTPAYREGRIAGPGAWFTSGNVGWEFYQLDGGQLLRLARACAAIWKPGQEIPTVNDTEKAAVAVHAVEILKIVKPEALQWWARLTPPYKVRAVTNPLTLYLEAGMFARTINATWDIDVFERHEQRLRVTGGSDPNAEGLWVKVADVAPV
jgi:hypothetical protein